MTSPYDPDYQHLLTQLRKAREDAGLRQEDVAKALGVTQAFISRCERGQRRIDPIELQRFSLLYGRPLSFFLPKKTPKRAVRNPRKSG